MTSVFDFPPPHQPSAPWSRGQHLVACFRQETQSTSAFLLLGAVTLTMAFRYVSWTLVSRAASTRTAKATTFYSTSTTNHRLSPSTWRRCFSSVESKGIFGRIRDAWDDRNKKVQQEKYLQQLDKMSSTDKWTLKDFHDELKETLGSWRNRIPGMSGLKQIKVAKQTQKVIEACIDYVGAEATAKDLQTIDRQEKVS